MPSSVLYYCPCDQIEPTPSAAASSSHTPAPAPSTSAAAAAAAASPFSSSQAALQLALTHPPHLPAYSTASCYSFHPLPSLYFCDECDQIRCNRCVSVDIASYFCPNCLFEVPHASVKQARSKCARNCFLCPCCTHTLSVVATDPEEASNLTSPDASVGQPPYFLQCSFCKWDSKGIGLVFDKPTGLGRQLDKTEQSAPDLLELYHLRDHFDPFITAQAEAAAAAAAASQHRKSAAAGGKPGSSSSASAVAKAKPRASTSQASIAASTALQKSKLLRDLPQLASGRYLSGVAEKPRPNQREEREELKPYEPFTSWISGRTQGQEKGVLGRREESRKEYMSGITGSADRISTLQQRWTSPWDQPVRASDLHPVRVPLKCKQSKRCPACRHIIIKPDPKADSKRFKIKLVALNYLPEIEVELSPDQPYLQPAGLGGTGSKGPGASGSSAASRLNRRTSMLNLASGSSSLRRRPMSMYGSGGSSFSTSSGIGGPDAVDEESLQPGRTYVFEATFTNPLDDAMRIKLGIARISIPTSQTSSAPPIFPELEPSTEELERIKATERDAARPAWSVTPSTTAFSIDAYNEVWELEEDQDLLAEDDKDGDDDNDEVDDRADELADAVRQDGDDRSRRKRKKTGIIRRKGHKTTIGLEVTLRKDISEGMELQSALLVTYTYHPEGNEDAKKKSASGGGGVAAEEEDVGSARPFSFWIAVRYGKVGRVADVGAKKAALEKRKSVLGLSSSASAATGAAAAETGAGSAAASEAPSRGLDIVEEAPQAQTAGTSTDMEAAPEDP